MDGNEKANTTKAYQGNEACDASTRGIGCSLSRNSLIERIRRIISNKQLEAEGERMKLERAQSALQDETVQKVLLVLEFLF